MNILEKHEIFEMEVLEKLNNGKALQRLVFGGGTMLRLCHEMNRFSARDYDITDAQVKHYTILVEIRSSHFPKRLKIEIRREPKDSDFEQKIAYSPFSTRQVLVWTHTLRQALANKISALLDRGEIRDAFDMEFILRQGVPLPRLSDSQKQAILSRLDGFKPQDFKVTLGSVLGKDIRAYYVEHQFGFLRRKIEMN